VLQALPKQPTWGYFTVIEITVTDITEDLHLFNVDQCTFDLLYQNNVDRTMSMPHIINCIQNVVVLI